MKGTRWIIEVIWQGGGARDIYVSILGILNNV